VSGSIRGISICCDTKNANAKPKHMRMRRLTARIEKIEVNAKNADKRNIGQTMTKNFSSIFQWNFASKLIIELDYFSIHEFSENKMTNKNSTD
jgi:hypothetical protein